MDGMTCDEFHEYMKEQVSEIKRSKWIESEKAGHDLGNEFAIEWIKEHHSEFRESYLAKCRDSIH
jgi:hypothetical protein